MKYLLRTGLLLCAFVSANSFAQSSLKTMKSSIDKSDPTSASMKMDMVTDVQAGMLFRSGSTLTTTEAPAWLSKQLAMRQGVDILSAEGNSIQKGRFQVNKLHQYYKGIRVEHGVINTTSKDSKVALMQMEYYSIPDNFKTTATISEATALQKAMNNSGAKQFAWKDDVASDDPDFQKPKGQLVIVSTYNSKNPAEVCLAYKFTIYALNPVSKSNIYVNAWDGTVVLNDAIIKHAKGREYEMAEEGNEAGIEPVKIPVPLPAPPVPANLPATKVDLSPTRINNIIGSADTRTCGTQQIVTDDGSERELGKPYRLLQTRNQQTIHTLNYFNRPYNVDPDNDPTASEFDDDDNNWTAAEYHDLLDDAALDVHFSMQVISDYWKNIHDRNGWDDKNGPITSYVHCTEATFDANGNTTGANYFPNAFWNGKNMHFGDGNGDFAKSQPYTTLDLSAHEMGHAITETTSSLIYQWESGAINEAFSDIWSACITNYALQHFTIQNERIYRIAEKAENLNQGYTGFRDMANPLIFSHPSTYKSIYWKNASLQTCPTFTTTNDNCGVHYNSGVFNKWFYLITNGEFGTNTLNKPYNVVGLGFATTEELLYMTSINLTPNAGFQTTRIVSTNIAISLYGAGSAQVAAVKNAWNAVGVDSSIYDMSNTPVFTSNNFTSVAVDKNGDVWAGTSYQGLYHYNGTSWEKRAELTNVKINDIKADVNGNIWVAQSGTQAGGTQALAGGVSYFKAPYAAADYSFYTVGAQANIPSRNVRNIYCDPYRNNDVAANPKVWIATSSYLSSENSVSGAMGMGLFTSGGKAFTSETGGLNVGSNVAGITCVGGTRTAVYGYAPANNGVNQLLVYNPDLGDFDLAIDNSTAPKLPTGFSARSIYGDAKGRLWVALAANAVAVLDENAKWHYIDLAVLNSGYIQPSFNAITGDKDGNVYIGTTANGILFFDKGDETIAMIDQPAQYRFYTTINGLPSNNITAVSFDNVHYKLMVASDAGVMFYEPLCIGKYCKIYKASAAVTATTTGPGNWSNPLVWSTGKVPDSTTLVVIAHAISVDINAKASTLSVLSPGTITVLTGKNLSLFRYDGAEVIMTSTGNKVVAPVITSPAKKEEHN